MMTALITRRNLLALLLAVVFACSLFTVGAFAADEETTTAAEETTTVAEETTDATEDSSVEESTEATTGETTGESTEGTTESATTEGTTAGTTEEGTTLNFWEEEFTRVNSKTKERVLYWTKIAVWVLVIAGLIAGGVFCIVKKEKVGEFLRALNSEKKRIVWTSWKETRKNTFVVLVVVAAITLVIFLFNMVLEKIFGGTSTGGDLWFQKSLLEWIRQDLIGFFK